MPRVDGSGVRIFRRAARPCWRRLVLRCTFAFSLPIATLIIALAAALWPQPAASADTVPARSIVLLMVDDLGCPFCARWDAEVGSAYAKSAEGQFAPLDRRRRGQSMPAQVGPIAHTPTFIVLRDGAEVGRITGYPGAHFFWPMLDAILARIGFEVPRAGG